MFRPESNQAHTIANQHKPGPHVPANKTRKSIISNGEFLVGKHFLSATWHSICLLMITPSVTEEFESIASRHESEIRQKDLIDTMGSKKRKNPADFPETSLSNIQCKCTVFFEWTVIFRKVTEFCSKVG